MSNGPEDIAREQIDHASGVTGVVQDAKAENRVKKKSIDRNNVPQKAPQKAQNNH